MTNHPVPPAVGIHFELSESDLAPALVTALVDCAEAVVDDLPALDHIERDGIAECAMLLIDVLTAALIGNRQAAVDRADRLSEAAAKHLEGAE